MKQNGKETLAKSRKRKRKKLKLNWRIVIAAGAVLVFIAAFLYYFASTFIVTERNYAVYSSMDEPSLPIVYAEADGRKINMMHGYLQEMGSAASADCITPLTEDRKLKLQIKFTEGNISSIKYEVRSLDLGHFIEKTELDVYRVQENGDVDVELPIQNMIEKDTQYLLKLQIDQGEKTINYYTKIIWTESRDIFNMIDAASEFTQKSFDANQARDLTVYLENDPSADMENLGRVSLASGFSQITWGDTGMSLASEPDIRVKEYDGIMGAVEVSYTSESEGNAGQNDKYYNKDEFTMKTGSERIYMMNLERKTNQVFDGNKNYFTDGKIDLGITNSEDIQTDLSQNGRFIAFKSGRELWMFDQTEKKAINIFSFRSENDKARADYDMHDIKILSVGDDGSVDFAVYGYMNRGRHEGYNGIVYYNYQNGENSISELFFIPRACTYEKIKKELDELLTKADTGMIYMKQADSVVAIDLNSLEMLDVISDIYNKNYAVSRDQTMLAWTESEGKEQNSIKLMELSSGITQTISAEAGQILSTVAFYGKDLIYGISDAGSEWMINNKYRGRPMHTLKIVSSKLNEKMSYEKPGLYFEDIVIDADRIQLSQYRKDEERNTYHFAGKDTIVGSGEEIIKGSERLSSELSEKKKKIYYIELDEKIKAAGMLKVGAPKLISYEKSGTLELVAHKSTVTTRYYAYSNGRLEGVGYNLKDAIDLCYDAMGWVTDENAAVLYSRCDRVSSKVIQDPFNAAQPLVLALEGGFNTDMITEDGYLVMDAQGTALNKLLYYVGKGYPVLAYTEENKYCLIYGFTADSIELYYPAADESGGSSREKMSMEDAAVYFDQYQNDFIVFKPYPGKKGYE